MSITNEIFSIYDYRPPLPAGGGSFRAQSQWGPVFLRIQPLNNNINSINISRSSLCPGLSETRLMSLVLETCISTTDLLTMILIERAGHEMVVRSRECEILVNNDGLCLQCQHLLSTVRSHASSSFKQELESSSSPDKPELELKPIKSDCGEEEYDDDMLVEDLDQQEDIEEDENQTVTLSILKKKEDRYSPFIDRLKRKKPKSIINGNKVGMSDLRYRCCFCDVNFTEEEEFIQHDHEKHLEDDNFCCPEENCDFVDSKRRNVMNHFAEVHPKVKENGQVLQRNLKYCNLCDHAFFDKSTLYTHKRNVHNEDLDHQTCPLCYETFENEKQVKTHLRIHVDGKYRCIFQVCGKPLFDTKEELENHNLKFHNIQDSYVCDICGQDFPKKFRSKYLRHVQIHGMTEKKAKCEYCDEKFYLEADVRSHILSRCGPLLMCSQCPATMKGKYNLANHMQVHSDQKKYECEVCGKKFRVSQYLKSHLAMHSTERNHPCSVCGKGFKLKKHLNVHMKIHTGDFVYCEFCNKGFAQKCNLKLHVKNSHNK